MFGRKALPFGTIVLVSIIALAVMGLGYAWWNTQLTDAGEVNTGSFKADWVHTSTDDDGAVFLSGFDSNDDGTDPSYMGPDGPRTSKKVGACASWINSNPANSNYDESKVYWKLDHVYPGYYCTVWSVFHNESTTPMKIQSAGLASDPGITVGYVPGYAPATGTVVEPWAEFRVGMWVRVDESAVPDATYSGSSNITLVQWNAP